ncbi:MAG: hypothetical protein ACR2KM_11005 [Gemmatimonadaceae bacterium]
MQQRTRMLLHRLIKAMNSTETTDVQYYIQQTAPVLLRELDRATALRKSL